MDQAMRLAHSKRLLLRTPVQIEQPENQSYTRSTSTKACICGTRPGDAPGTLPVCPVCLRFAATRGRYMARRASETGEQQ